MRPFLAAAAAVLLFAGPALAQTPSQVVKRDQGALQLENVPETPPEVRERLRQYQNTRSAGFLDWLADGSILISTRFGQAAQVHRVTAPGAQRTQITFFDEPVGEVEAQPGARDRFVLGRDVGGSEYFQGYLKDLAGRETPVTEARTRNTDFVFSRDGALLAWSRVTPGSGDYDIMVMRPDDPASRRVALEGTGALAPLAFSPDGRMLLLERYISIQASQRFLLDLQTGALTEIAPSRRPVSYMGGEFTADGAGVLLLSDQGSEVRRLVRYDLASRRFSPVADGGAWEIEQFDLSDDGRTLAWVVNVEGRSELMLRDVATGQALPKPELPLGVIGGMGFSPDGAKLAFGLNRATAPSDVWVADVTTGALTRWTFSELGGLDPAAMIEPELIRYRTFDGREIPAWVYRPKAAGKVPVILSIHGGPEAQAQPTFSATFQYWANEMGAAVIVPNVRGSAGYGKTYVALDNGVKRRDAVRDIGALLDWIGAQPDLDASRVVVTGGSYGGYMTLATLADYNDRVAGAISTVGISNWLTFLANTEGYRRDLRRAEYGDERDPKIRAFLEADSPLGQTARMTRPLFIVMGFNDPRVPWTEGRQVADAVRANGGDVWWMMARDEGHGFRKKSNVDALREAETLFLRKVFGAR